jgi:gas vesicle protein
MKSMTFWAMFTLGLAVGAGVALCYAPQTGKQTRRKLRSGWNDASEYVKDQSDEFSAKAEKLYKRGRKHAEGLMDDASSVVDRAASVGRKVANLV